MSSDQELARKLLVLDARDKVLRLRMTKQTELSQANSYTGSCEDMCPERERYTRLGYRLSVFERNKVTNQSDEYAMVKEYRRAGADQEEPLPHDLRTPKALETTVDYLICNIMDDSRSLTPEYSLEWYDFLWDRLRAIRKDITQQNICNELAAILVERCTRFHVHSCYAMNRVKDFDVDMNKRNLNDCLQMLRQLYDDLKVSIGFTCDGELEFQKYDILLHLGEDALSTNTLMKKANQHAMNEAKLITSLFNAYSNNNYFNFFKVMQKADYMTSCILSLYVNRVRLNAMKIIVASCTSRQSVLYPASMIIESLGFDDTDDLKTFTDHLEIEVQKKDSKHYLVLRKEHMTNIRMASTTLPPIKSKKLVEDKMNGLSVGQLVYGQSKLPPNPYKINPLQTSIHLYEMLSEEQEPVQFDSENDDDVSMSEEIVDDFGSGSMFDAEITSHSKPQTTWLKDVQPIIQAELKRDHFEIVDIPKRTDTTKQSPKINDSKPALHCIEADNQPSESKSNPTNVIINCSMGPKNEPPLSGLIPQQTDMVDNFKPSTEDQDNFNLTCTKKPILPQIANNVNSSSIFDVKVTDDESTKVEWYEDDQPDKEGLEIELLPNEAQKSGRKSPLESDLIKYAYVSSIMPAGKMRKSKRLPRFAPMPLEPKVIDQSREKVKVQSKRISEINAIKECALDEENANMQFYKIFRMII